MKIKLPDASQFNFKECVIAGDDCVLITPKDMGVVWCDDNKIFRSSIWRTCDNHPVSLSFKKFTNHGEKPEFEPWNKDCLPYTAITKVDGSTLIVSRYRGETIIRTRGTVDATTQENGHEIAFFRKKYPKVFNNKYLDQENTSLLFEWTTPTNRIVLRESDTPCLALIGAVCHETYQYIPQSTLDIMAIELETNRPMCVDIANFDEMLKFVEYQTNIEGVVVYSADGQTLKKIKTSDYLRKHKIYTGVKTFNHVLNLWIQYNCPERHSFEQQMTNEYDWELVQQMLLLIDELFSKWINIQQNLDVLNMMIKNHAHLSRKEMAQLFNTNCKAWSGVAFEMLDGKKHNILKLFSLISQHPNIQYWSWIV